MNREKQYDGHTRAAKYWRKQAQKTWANLKHSDCADETDLQYNKVRYLRRARRYHIRGLKRI